MDILDHIKNLIFDIKLIIFANLHLEIISKINVSQNISEMVFKYRYESYYHEIKNIIKVNRELNFDDYIEEGSYLWKILLKDMLFYEHKLTLYELSMKELLTAYLSHEFITIGCMINFYKSYPELYIHLNKLLEDKSGIYLLYDAITFPDIIKRCDISKVLKYKDTVVDVNTWFVENIWNNFSAINIVVPSIILIHFLKQFKSMDKLIFIRETLINLLNELITEESRYESGIYKVSFYNRYEVVINKYLDRL